MKMKCIPIFLLALFLFNKSKAFDGLSLSKTNEIQYNLSLSTQQKPALLNDDERKNILAVFPLTFVKLGIPISYERQFAEGKFGAAIHFRLVNNVATWLPEFKYYFKRTDAKDFSFGKMTLKSVYWEAYTGLILGYEAKADRVFGKMFNKSKVGDLVYSGGLSIGGRLNFPSGLNFGVFTSVYAKQVIKSYGVPESVGKYYIDWRDPFTYFSVGWRF